MRRRNEARPPGLTSDIHLQQHAGRGAGAPALIFIVFHVKDVIAERIGDEPALVSLDALADMRMMLDDDRGALLDQPARQSLPPRGRVSDEFQIGVQHHDDEVSRISGLGHPAQEAPLIKRRHPGAVLGRPAGRELRGSEKGQTCAGNLDPEGGLRFLQGHSRAEITEAGLG